jgi:hypothetical protein
MRPSALFVGMLIKVLFCRLPELPSNEEPSSVVGPDNRRAFPESRFSTPTCSLALFHAVNGHSIVVVGPVEKLLICLHSSKHEESAFDLAGSTPFIGATQELD